MLKSRILFLTLIALLGLTIFSCDKDDDDMDPEPEETAMLTVDDQVISQNTIVIPSMDVPREGWVVIHRDNGSGGPVVPEIISEPVSLSSGVNEDVEVPIKSSEALTDGETVWVMLHEDTGERGKYEFDGGDIDKPFFTDNGSAVVSPIQVSSPSIAVSEQPVYDNKVIIESVTAAQDGWIVIHNDDGSGNITLPGIIGKAPVSKGVNENIEIELDSNNIYAVDQKLFPMLHLDNGKIGEYEFDGSENSFDGPEVFGNEDFPANVIFTSFAVTQPIGSLEVDDQVISQNSVLVSSVELPADGWVVIHRDNGNGGPTVPAIISEPVYLESGTTENVSVPVLDSESLTDGETLWIMLHVDNGTTKTYEFDGQNGLDGPYFTESGDIAITPIEISTPAIEVSDQKIVDNKVTIGKVTAAADGWLVIHNDDGTGNIVLPDIIGKVQVSKGVTEDVEISLDESVSFTVGQKLFPMLHIDTGEIGEYEFDGNNGLDGPEIFGNADFPGNVIFTSFTVE
ncbi:hypothetical protein KUV50_09670 [Membranicola marinus]|uniref:DUF7282 domain-containing protein n=1 Tax=Membranihabitans marinus TaxID=1227546 RepID=A0A953HNK5_9BACT|nr:hypothetical protein [Membranihabitans marinus]MBY5958399.1 hypothetical protein [Membranihabitans marinus]